MFRVIPLSSGFQCPGCRVVRHGSHEYYRSSRSLQMLSIRSLSYRRRLRIVPMETYNFKFSSSIQCRAFDLQSEKESSRSSSDEEWLLKNDGALRAFPLVLAAIGGFSVVLNRSISGIAAIADAGSSQSRADVLCLALAATLALNGLVWKSLQPKPPITVVLEGVDCMEVDQRLPSNAQAELRWAWEALRSGTRCRSFVVVYRGVAVMQAGKAREGDDRPGLAMAINSSELLEGSLCSAVMETGKANYMANLKLYPGRFQLPFLPENTQAVIAQPLGTEGVMLVAGDMVRGFGPLDQAWISTVAQKVDSTLVDCLNESLLD